MKAETYFVLCYTVHGGWNSVCPLLYSTRRLKLILSSAIQYTGAETHFVLCYTVHGGWNSFCPLLPTEAETLSVLYCPRRLTSGKAWGWINVCRMLNLGKNLCGLLCSWRLIFSLVSAILYISELIFSLAFAIIGGWHSLMALIYTASQDWYFLWPLQ